MEISDFENLLIDVRRAYRLLYLYQRRVIDLIKYIGGRLAFNSYQENSWFNDNLKSNHSPNEKVPWEHLIMYFIEFYFGEKEISGTKIKFSILVQSDSGYYDSESNNPYEVENFNRAEYSSSKIIFLIGKNTWHNDHSADFASASRLYKNETSEYKKIIDGKVLLVKSYNFQDFFSMETTNQVIANFIDFCNRNGIPELRIIY